jgi:hypothetical protein
VKIGKRKRKKEILRRTARRGPIQPPFVELIIGCEKFEVNSDFRHTDINS